MTSNANHNHHSKSELFQQIISSFEDPKDLVDAIESKKEQRRITLRQGQSGQLPQNTTEMWLSKVWHDILAVPLVYRDDDFFHLGGNSLQAIQVVSRIRQEYYVELPLQQFFEHRTLGAMASAVQNLQTAVPGSTQPPLDIAHISTRPNQSVHPLSFSQERLWFLTQLEPASSLYNIPLAVQLDGEANQLALEASLDAIWQRHEALRARFFNMDGVTKQQITPFRSFPLSVVDLQTVQRPTALVQSFIQAEVDHQFDLAQEDLLRVVLLRLAPDKHILLMTLHHIVADRWSLGVIARELVAAYQAYIQSGQIRLPDLPIQYADFAHWQFNWLQGAELERQRTYWQAQLAQCPPTLPLPTDMPRPAKPTYLIDKRMMRLSVSLSEAIKQLSRQQGCTLFMTLLAAFNILLARYTRQTDMAVGTFTANRNRAEIEDLIGYFVNTLTLRTDLSGQPTFVELLTRVREVTLGAYAHQDFPFKLVLEALNPDRNLAQNPLFQVMLVLQNTPLSSVDLPNLDVTYLPIENQLSNMDLTLWVHEESKGLDFALEYNASLFKPETIDQMLMHFQTLLEYVVADPYQPIEMYSILTSTERARLLTEFSAGPAVLWPMAGTLNQLFENQVVQTPEAIALISEEGTSTYYELNRQANRLACYLKAQGLIEGDRVGIYLPRSLSAIISILAILKAGGIYVPFDTASPSSRLKTILENARPKLTLTLPAIQDNLPDMDYPVLCLDQHQAAIAEQPDQNLSLHRLGEEAAYIIYTSGSTGKPKGVVGHHHGIVNRLQWMWQAYPFLMDEVCCHKTSISFVDAICEIFSPLLQGIPSVIITQPEVEDLTRFVQVLAKNRVSRIVLVPALLQALLDEHSDLSEILPHLQHWTTSGETLPLGLYRRFRESAPNATLLNIYGSSEVAADVTYCDLNKVPPSSTVPIGRPIANNQIYILDQQLEPVPIGVFGDIYVGGVSVAESYFEQPDLTAACFLPDPFSVSVEGRLYKMGDMGRFLADGQIEFAGRSDQQVQVRGYRVELGEIETALQNHPLVQHCLVLSHDHFAEKAEQAPAKMLVAYVTCASSRQPKSDHLRQFLRSVLPEYMIPQRYQFLDQFPLTPSGKIDRQQLLVQPLGVQAKRAIAQPRTETERLLLDIWQDVLDMHDLGTHDNFFYVGGHSVVGLRLMARIQRCFDKKLPLVSLFEAPTVAQMAAFLDGELPTPSFKSLVPIQAQGEKPPLFLVHGMGGQVLFYERLIYHLGYDQPAYGLQRLKSDSLNQYSVSEIAALYVAELQSVQPTGPYLVGGYCLGGLIAFEMAQQLIEQGSDVSLLALITPGYPPGVNRPMSYYPGRLVDYVRHRIPVDIFLDASMKKTKQGIQEMSRYLQLNLKPDDAESKMQVKRAMKQNYMTHPFLGKITLFETSERTKPYWAALARDGVDYYPLPTSHQAIFREPYIQQLAENLKAALP